MSHNFKTLIVFDTNSLRSTDGDKVVYATFEFGSPFRTVEQYLIDNNLSDSVSIAVPAWALVELKDQKERQYSDDIENFKKHVKRLKDLPHFAGLDIDETSFNCGDHIQQKSVEYLDSKKEIAIIQLDESKANEILKSMMERVLKKQKAQRPFSQLAGFKDAGFKDNIIWESILNYEELKNFDKLIFLTKDGDYAGCEYEFRGKWNKHIEITRDERAVIDELEKDYKNYIEYRMLYNYAKKEYFLDYLNDLISPKTKISFEEEDCVIENFRIENPCVKVEMAEDEDGDFSMPVIDSKIIINAKKESGEKVDIPLEVLTKYTDVEYMELYSTTGLEDLS